MSAEERVHEGDQRTDLGEIPRDFGAQNFLLESVEGGQRLQLKRQKDRKGGRKKEARSPTDTHVRARRRRRGSMRKKTGRVSIHPKESTCEVEEIVR